MHVLYVLSLLPTYRATVLKFLAHHSLPLASRYYQTMLESVYLQKLDYSYLSQQSAIYPGYITIVIGLTYITSHKDVLTFCKSRLSNFSLKKVFEVVFSHLRSDTTCGRTA